jgi:TraM recognition site of TraD and TraG
MRSWGVTLWSFWQNVAQLSIYGEQATTLLDNAGVIQCLGSRNRQAAEKVAAMVGGFSADEILTPGPDEEVMRRAGGRCAASRSGISTRRSSRGSARVRGRGDLCTSASSRASPGPSAVSAPR